jgi:8-hydroxy-5-deazaflavin:NADPH oxidoreductase
MTAESVNDSPAAHAAPPAEEPSAVAIIGATGALGYGLALRLGAAGVPVVIGSRDAGRAAEAAARARDAVPGGSFDGTANPEAAARAGTVVLSVPFASQAETVRAIAPALAAGQVVVDATVPLATATGGRPTHVLGVWHGSAAQQAQALVPDGVRVVGALHTVSAAALADLEHQLDEDVLVTGDRRADKAAVADLVRRIPGLRPVDAGRLEMSRIAESMTALMISMNGRYKTRSGLRITGLPDELWPTAAPNATTPAG